MASLACVNHECSSYGQPGQGNLREGRVRWTRKTYGPDQIRSKDGFAGFAHLLIRVGGRDNLTLRPVDGSKVEFIGSQIHLLEVILRDSDRIRSSHTRYQVNKPRGSYGHPCYFGCLLACNR